jgi:hypothetical protein
MSQGESGCKFFRYAPPGSPWYAYNYTLVESPGDVLVVVCRVFEVDDMRDALEHRFGKGQVVKCWCAGEVCQDDLLRLSRAAGA